VSSAGNVDNPSIKQAFRSNKHAKWRAAHALDVELMVKNHAIKLVSTLRLRELEKEYGTDRVDLRYMIYQCKVKHNAKGEVTKYKVRGCVADSTDLKKVDDTFSAAVLPVSRRLVAQVLAMFPHATSAQNDVQGAYYYGTPTAYEDGGRILLCHIPDELVEYGFPQHDENGNRNYIEVVGNIPGRQEAGRIWGDEYTSFLTGSSCALSQSEVDRRIVFTHDAAGFIIVAIYVDDSWYISTSTTLETSFVGAWSKQYKSSSDTADTVDEFCGMLIERHDDGSVAFYNGKKTYTDLAAALEDHPLPAGYTCAYPMAANGLRLLKAEESEKNPRMPEPYLPAARRILGIGGFACCGSRPDGYLTYSAITQRVGHHFTLNVWKAILRWAHYLVQSSEQQLTYRSTDAFNWCSYADAALANLPEGGAFGGIVFGLDGLTGILEWRCLVSNDPVDSSGSAELVNSTYALKSILGFSMMLRELQLITPGPVPLYLDANAVINGAEMEKVTREMRFMAARYAMLRKAVTLKQIVLTKVASEDNKADIFTKPLTGAAFMHARKLVLGHI
jgi:hypothetical protein